MGKAVDAFHLNGFGCRVGRLGEDRKVGTSLALKYVKICICYAKNKRRKRLWDFLSKLLVLLQIPINKAI
jgi:hypothetical protein